MTHDQLNLVKDFLSFNRREQRGIMVLIFLLTGIIVTDALLPSLVPEKPLDFTRFQKESDRFMCSLHRLDSIDSLKMHRYPQYIHGKSYDDKGIADSRKTKETLMIDLNTADTMDLQRLRGIGSSFAGRIVKYRERLGGFIDKSQLMEVFGMDDTRYKGIEPNVTVSSVPVRRIDINAVTFKDLMKHPYFPFPITKAIMLYRKEHKVIQMLSELKRIQGINDSVYRKIEVYLKVAEK
jgi:competence ComEA-like helix-hairpin-helix protein